MLRTAALLLVLANLGFFAWTRGWLQPGFQPPRQGEHEPQRLTAQLNPQAVTVLPPRAASAAVVAARAAAAVCMEAGPLAESEMAAAEAELQAALPSPPWPQGSWTREVAPPQPLWLVFAGRWPDAEARRERVADLRKLGLEAEVLTAPAALAQGLVISRHATRAEAEAALARLSNGTPPLRGSRVTQLPTPPAVQWLRVARADAELQARLKELPAAPLAGGFKPCGALAGLNGAAPRS